MSKYPKFSDLFGKTLESVVGKVGDEEIVFITVDGEKYRLVYHHDCCAGCSIEDICGDLSDLIGSEVLIAEEVKNEGQNPEGVKHHKDCCHYPESLSQMLDKNRARIEKLEAVAQIAKELASVEPDDSYDWAENYAREQGLLFRDLDLALAALE